MIKSHLDLKVYQKSIDLIESVYVLTKSFPKSEMYGLSQQIKRASISIASNIAEGASRKGTKEYIHFLYISLASISEVHTQLIIAKRLKFINNFEQIENELLIIKKMLLKLIGSLKLRIV